MRLRPEIFNRKYKSQLCKGYHKSYHCPYGIKCSFIHNNTNKTKKSFYYTKLNNLKEISSIETVTSLNNKRITIFQEICQNKLYEDNFSSSDGSTFNLTNDELF